MSAPLSTLWDEWSPVNACASLYDHHRYQNCYQDRPDRKCWQCRPKRRGRDDERRAHHARFPQAAGHAQAESIVSEQVKDGARSQCHELLPVEHLGGMCDHEFVADAGDDDPRDDWNV